MAQWTDQMLQAGAARLALLGKHAKLLMRAYLGEPISEADLSDAALKKLLAARILWRAEDEPGLKLSHRVADLLAEMLADEQRRQVHADVGETLEKLHLLIQAYREAQHRGDYLLQDQHQRRLVQEVDHLNSRLSDAIDSLWKRLNSDFGFVTRLSDKIRENERAQKQITRLLDGLALIDFAQLIEEVEGSGPLRRLLVSQLQQQVSRHYASLRSVQARLIELMARWRQQQARSLLAQGMLSFLKEHPNYSLPNYAQQLQPPAWLNVAAPLLPAAALTLEDLQQQPLMQHLHQLPALQHPTARFSEQAAPSQQQAETQVETGWPLMKQAVEGLYLDVLDSQEPLSALAYQQQHYPEWDAEIWLFQVLAEYLGLPQHQQQALRLYPVEEAASDWNQVQLIRDLLLWDPQQVTPHLESLTQEVSGRLP
ncbi:hypothetical protein V6U78_09890 [Marinospirillum sp. MEB164]|uniref:Uncharacterized protein n=1 Tax=Marinospirillum alkalitolerans TaxID=3123374 RepID=A0ABW8PYK4_9GAMM